MKLPKKYQGFGLHLWCNKDKRVVTKSPCGHTDRLVFQSRIYNPHTKRQDIIRTWSTRSGDEAWQLHLNYKRELESVNFQITKSKSTIDTPSFYLKECILRYFDYLLDADVPTYERKHLSQNYIKDQKRYIMRFAGCMKKIESRLSSFHVKDVSKDHVSAWHTYVENLGFSKDSYNHHINSIKYFFKYLQSLPGADFDNPFDKVKNKAVYRTKEILTESDFNELFAVITHENGHAVKGKKEQALNYYRPWLIDAFKLAVLTGERRGGLVQLKWKHKEENFIIIPNFKVNAKENTDIYRSYAFITSDLAELLIKLNPGDQEEFILAPDMSNRNTLKYFLSNAFAHFWKLTDSPKKVSLNSLRKTYVTRMKVLLGDASKNMKHTNEETANNHYINDQEIMAKLDGQRMFNFE